jgi:hypothetical protein
MVEERKQEKKYTLDQNLETLTQGIFNQSPDTKRF